ARRFAAGGGGAEATPPGRPLDRDRHDGLDAKQKFQRARGGLQLLGVTIAVRAREHRSRRRVISSRCWPAPPAISPLLVLFAVFFWSFLWEIPGAFSWRTGHYCDANNVRPVRRQLLARGATLRFGKPEIGPVAPGRSSGALITGDGAEMITSPAHSPVQSMCR